MCILTAKVILRGKALKSGFGLQEARGLWMGHLCLQLLLGHAGQLG